MAFGAGERRLSIYRPKVALRSKVARVVCDFKPRKSASHSPLHRRVLFNRLTIPAPPPRRPRSRFLSRFLSRFSFAAARTRFLFYAVCDFSCQRASNPPVSNCQSQTAVASGESSATTRSACKQSCQQACASGPFVGPPSLRPFTTLFTSVAP